MKKITKILAAIMVASIMLGCTTALAAPTQITGSDLGLTDEQVNNLNKQDIYINGNKLVYDEAKYGIAYITPAPSRTMIPMRIFAESFGLNVYWDSTTSSAKCEGPLGLVEMKNGSYSLTVNGEEIKFDQPTVDIRNGITYVGLRAFCNAIGITDEGISWRPGRIDITCDMDSMVVIPGNNGISTIVDARTWKASDMTKTIAYMNELKAKYADATGGFSLLVDEEENELWLSTASSGLGTLSITATVDTVGTEGQFNDVHIQGVSKNGAFRDDATKFMEIFLSETISTEACQKIMAAYDIYLDNYKQYADNEWYNDEKKTAVIDAWENTVMSTNYKVNDDVVLSLTFDGWHISDIGYYEENGWALTDISELKSIW